MKKARPIKNTWYDWLNNYNPEAIRKSGFEDEVISFFKTNTPKQIVYMGGKKLKKSKTQQQSEENIIISIRNIFILKKEKKVQIE